jgi:hypothetical protein
MFKERNITNFSLKIIFFNVDKEIVFLKEIEIFFFLIVVAVNVIIRYGLVVRISGSHPGGPGSIPGIGKMFLIIMQ